MKPPLTTTPGAAPTETVSTDNARLSLLDAHCGRSLAYTGFKNAAKVRCAPFSCDADLANMEAAAAEFLQRPVNAFELDINYSSPAFLSWTRMTALLSEGKLNWWKDADTAPVVEVPCEDNGGYFPDEPRDLFDEGGEAQ